MVNRLLECDQYRRHKGIAQGVSEMTGVFRVVVVEAGEPLGCGAEPELVGRTIGGEYRVFDDAMKAAHELYRDGRYKSVEVFRITRNYSVICVASIGERQCEYGVDSLMDYDHELQVVDHIISSHVVSSGLLEHV